MRRCTQTSEAKQEGGRVAYSAHLQLRIAAGNPDSMVRNGCKEILIVNGHGGNKSLLPY